MQRILTARQMREADRLTIEEHGVPGLTLMENAGGRVYELLAHHFTEAGIADRAIAYWHAAGNRSLQLAAVKEGELHLSRGLDLLPNIADPNERDRLCT